MSFLLWIIKFVFNFIIQNVIQLFMTNALHVFVAQSGTEYPMLLEEQVDTCKRVLNIYRYMVMHTYMSLKTW